MEKGGYVYIMTNRRHTVLYTGVTSDLRRRVYEHKTGACEGFTKKYNVHKLVFAEHFPYISQAIEAEKTIKAGSRARKIELIENENTHWQDLDIFE